MATEGSGESFATLTHARLRAAQGDVAGAVRILRVILAAQPDHGEARGFLESLEDRVAITYRESADIAVEGVRPAAADELKGRFREALGGASRVARLSRWLERVRRNRGERRVR